METNPGPRRPDPAVCRILCSNVRGQPGNLSDLTVASSRYDILLCSETLVSDMRHVSELLVPGLVKIMRYSGIVARIVQVIVDYLHNSKSYSGIATK